MNLPGMIGRLGTLPPSTGSTRDIAMVNVAGPGESRGEGDPKFAWIAAAVGAINSSIGTISEGNAADVAAADADAMNTQAAAAAREAAAKQKQTITTILLITGGIIAFAVAGWFLFRKKK